MTNRTTRPRVVSFQIIRGRIVLASESTIVPTRQIGWAFRSGGVVLGRELAGR
jgi:hypothetical protein